MGVVPHKLNEGTQVYEVVEKAGGDVGQWRQSRAGGRYLGL